MIARLVGLAIFVAFAGGCRHTGAENDAVRSGRHASGQLGLETPNLDGPDALELAPLVAVTESGLAFDHEPVDQAGLESRLRAYRANFSILHPGDPAPREILLACSPAIPSKRVFAVLETAHLLGFDRARLAFERMHSEAATAAAQRPARISAAQVSIGVDTGVKAEQRLIRSSDVRTCSQLSEKVVGLRRVGLPVTVVMPATK